MSKDIKKALEHCIEGNCDNCPNIDELGSGEIVCRGRLLPEVLEYVTDLEAKLAESEKEVNRFKSMKNREQLIKENEALKDTIAVVLSQKSEWIKSCNELKQQLAEKEKELFFYQNIIKEKPKTATAMCELLRPYELKLRENEMYKDRFESLYNHYNKDKISFAVEQLEKVKDTISTLSIADDENQIVPFTRDYKNGFSCCKSAICEIIIDNQIKQLKEGK